ncbi:MarR family winged helix-turn-helix transcriptional regulator [Nocardia crassostreae]|uniref:MarR family winged helix-turn-helix transcriptional regulator n=1 Tax=Nocardia crassostreae TaxID=53428 RepID=UPI0008364D66|nr:MarR family winged helix-turn-helix transcriptional regulator [Nocardia crassostreae]
MTDDPVADELLDIVGYQMTRLSRLRDRTNTQVAAATNGEVEPAAFAILFQLLHCGPMRSGALAESLYSDASTISRQVASLVKRGVLERRADPADGRVSVLAVTDLGRTAAAEIRALRNQALRTIFDQWAPAERESFAGLFERFVDDYEAGRQAMLTDLATRSLLFPKAESAESNS